jgi:hypothetical protein
MNIGLWRISNELILNKLILKRILNVKNKRMIE